MKWFFALNQACPTFPLYADLARVAVHSARRYTALEPVFLFDGDECELTDWLRGRAVTVVRHRTSLYPHLEELARRRGDPNVTAIGAGAFLRLDVPRLARELGCAGQHVLYTDCDVLFRREVIGELSRLRCRFFAVAPERHRRDYRHLNSGVMLMNLPALIAEETRFRAFVDRNLDRLIDLSWDQGAYQLYYRRPAAWWSVFFRLKWDRLPAELNWKPYWGPSARCGILHFHGPKPFQRASLDDPATPAILRELAGGSFQADCDEWERLRAEAVGEPFRRAG
jgi:hypothetical protein